jgi:hypothetical protein
LVTSLAKIILASFISCPSKDPNLSHSDTGNSVNNFRNLPTSASKVFLQYCQNSYGESLSEFNQIAPFADLPIFEPSAFVNNGVVKPKTDFLFNRLVKSIPFTMFPH